ncbi:MAG: pectinesterase family protein [Porphyromonadaceae bacterium]|nr:pectinesterase family protein [Porphyromonadaceae bacterium]
MKRIFLYLFGLCVITAFLALSADQKPVIYMIGDSTMANKSLAGGNPERGWGHVLPGFFSPEIKIDNRAINGRSSLSFMSQWDAIYNQLKKGDYVFIQFGHNDQKKKPDRYSDPDTAFKNNLRFYINQTREKGATPVLFTSIVRRKFGDDGKLVDTHGRYIPACKEVAEEMNVVCIDLNNSTQHLINQLGDEKSRELFMWVDSGACEAIPNGRKDDTLLKVGGARMVARMAVDSIEKKIPELAPYIRRYDYVVAKDGSGNFFTLQEAVDAVPAYRDTPTTIYVRNGVYKEKIVIPGNKTNIHLIGEEADSVIFTYDDYASKEKSNGQKIGTSGSASFYVYGSGFIAENVTFENSAGPVGQAVALFVAGDRCVFKKCKIKGFQDTLYTYEDGTREYYEECYIEGTTDFIFGKATAWFENCEIRSKQNSYVTAAATPEEITYGYVFNNCRLTADKGVDKVYLGRPWRPYAAVLFCNCDLGGHIRAEGWHNWGKASNEETARYSEYKNSGAGSDTKGRVAWSRQLSKKEAARYTIGQVLGGDDNWNPQAPKE